MDTTTTTNKDLQDDLKESAHRIWLAGLGALAAAGEEGTRMFNRLVDRGRDFETKGRVEFSNQVNQATSTVSSTWDSLTDRIDEAITSALHRMGVPTRDEIHTLTQRVEELNAKVEALRPRVTPAAAPEPAVVTATQETVTIVTPGTPDPTDPSKIIA